MTEIEKQLRESQEILRIFLLNTHNIDLIEKASEILFEAIAKGNKVITCGNGGSMCDAMHFAEELTGKYRDHRISLPAIAISDPSYITCTANDYGFDMVFSRFIEGLGKNGDVLLAFSTSGNSGNVINAAIAAKEKGMKVIALTGKDGGFLKEYCDIEIRAPYSDYADRAQEIHQKVVHCIIGSVESKLKL
ncbi:MAG: SIS domain-containing protein [Bacteroidales bacterium]|nr:SIS domain-containing protein [Bacteroidales bacterium]